MTGKFAEACVENHHILEVAVNDSRVEADQEGDLSGETQVII